MGNKKPSPYVPKRETTNDREFHRSTHADIGLTYSYPLRLQHRKHFSVESFEITPTDSECDMILPFWWIAKHPPSKPYGPPKTSVSLVKIVPRRKR
jgi:hypothetical protein